MLCHVHQVFAAMLHELLQHHLDRALRGVTYNAIRHCHAHNLHSIMLHDEPGNRIRLFVAESGHNLASNNGKDHDMSLAVHPHHCDVRFVNVYGRAENRRYAIVTDGTSDGDWLEMEYRSAITSGGPGSLTSTGVRGTAIHLGSERLDKSPSMRAEEMHTIWVPGSEEAAWLVIEGAEDGNYDSICWTLNYSPSMYGLYETMTQAEVATLLARCAHSTR